MYFEDSFLLVWFNYALDTFLSFLP